MHVHRFFDTLHRGIQAHRDDRDAIAQAVDDVTQGSRLLFFDEASRLQTLDEKSAGDHTAPGGSTNRV